MKKSLISFGALFLILSLLLGAFGAVSVSAENYDGIAATGILSPVNPNASQEAKNMLAYLSSLSDQQQFVVGQFDISTMDLEWDDVIDQFGVTPGLYSNRYVLQTADGGSVKPLAFNNVADANALLKEHYDEGCLLLVHADQFEVQNYMFAKAAAGKYDNDPAVYYQEDMGTIRYLDQTNPDRDLAMYRDWCTYLDNYISALQKLEDSGVKAYMIRLFVEYNYCGFCGTSAADYPYFVRVYQQTVQKFIDSGLTGWLMTYSPGSGGNTFGGYPGNEWMDVLACTMYSDNIDYDGHTALNGYGWAFPDYEWYVRTGKPIGLAELSCRGGDVTKKMYRLSWLNALIDVEQNWPRVTWANCWSGGNFSLRNTDARGDLYQGQDDGKSFMMSPYSLTLKDVPDYKTGHYLMPGVARIYPQTGCTGVYVGLEEKLYTSAELAKLGISLQTMGSFRVNGGYGITFYAEDNGEGKYWGYAASLTDAKSATGGKEFKSLRIAREQNIMADQWSVFASDNDEDAYKVNDGSQQSRWVGTADASGHGWLSVELDAPCTVHRWVIKNAGTAGEIAQANTVDYALQYSADGENWITLDKVTDNTANITDRTFAQVTSSYFRVYITKANALNLPDITVVEWELYGVDANGGKELPMENGLYNIDGSWAYVVDGQIATGYTGLVNYGGTYYFVSKGYIDWNTETLVNYGGSWWHVKGGKVVFDTTLTNYGGAWYYVGGGKVDFNATGLFNYYGTYYFINKGSVDFKTETLVNYGGSWWHVKGGKVVFDTTLVNYGGAWYYVASGKVNFGATGLCNYVGIYYYVSKGVVDFKTETLVSYGGSWWHIKGGKVIFDTTLVKYGNTWYYVQGGKVNFGASGKFNYYGTNYNIKNGVVVF